MFNSVKFRPELPIMQAPPLPPNEARRLQRLRQLRLLDTQAEAVLDAFTEVAATVCGLPMALISLVDHDRQWFKSAVGFTQGTQTSRDVSFCAHAVALGDGLFEVEDAREDPRFAGNPAVVGPPGVRHYAGMPLVMPGGERIGTLCVVDTEPGRLEPRHRLVLEKLARNIVAVFLLRESEHDLGSRLDTERSLRESERQAREALEDSHRRKDEFLAMLAHELRNPLAPISTAAQILRMSARDPDRVCRSAELISRQVSHMTALVDDLLDVSRVTRGLVQLESGPLDLREVVDAALEQSRGNIEARGHELVLRLPPLPLMVLGDRVRLTQVVANLLNNAAKYTQAGGLIALSLEARAGRAALQVQDNGSGIDPQLLPQIFDLFTQGSRSLDRSQGGLGLGLALARSMARLHAGEITASSEGRGLGSRFTLSLPLLEQPAVPQACEPAAPPPPNTGSLDVLVVDDNQDAAELLGVWLESHGHRPAVYFDPAVALDAALRNPADVYVLDIGLPGMDGYELARRLRANPRNRKATLIALTGYGQANDIARSREAGFDFHFVKPMDPNRLSILVAQLAPRPPAQHH
jgi:signal transduction histidine kinase/CheY-like chemotaxis protein